MHGHKLDFVLLTEYSSCVVLCHVVVSLQGAACCDWG